MKGLDFKGLKNFADNAKNYILDNKDTIKTFAKVTGIVLTAATSANAALKCEKIINELNKDKNYIQSTKGQKIWTVTKKVAPIVAPPIIFCGITITGVILDDKQSIKNQAAALAAYQLSEKKLSDYKSAVEKTVGAKKEKEIQATKSTDAVRNNPGEIEDITYTTSGQFLYMDYVSGRYFTSRSAKIDEVVNDVNRSLNHSKCVSLNDLYILLGLPTVGIGEDYEWNPDYLTDEFSIQTDPVKVPSENPLSQKYETCTVIYYDLHLVRCH